ncbi:MAG: CAAX prenyl protease-related protein [Phycisphaerae bacterium]|nr:CAAX prenyl protease-related protein [Phycisphaerae bacterium]
MALFMAGILVASHWPGEFPAIYAIKTAVIAIVLAICWPAYTKISWRHWKLGILFGIAGVVEWIAAEKLLLRLSPNYPRVHADPYDPTTAITSESWRIAFFAIRLIGASLVVPLMEELFWRDYVWRMIFAPNDFRLAGIGEWDRNAVMIVTLAFASEHVQWITAIGWGAMIAWLLIRTRSLGACIVMHAVTNFLLGVYVLWTHDWYFW